MRYLQVLTLCALLFLPTWSSAAGRLEPGSGATYAQFENSAITMVDLQVRAVPGFLQCIMIAPNDSAPTAGNIAIYDSLTETGTVIFSTAITTAAFLPFQICPQRPFLVGLYIGFTTTADVNVSVSYKK